MERAAYIIKPEGMSQRDQIRQALLAAGLRIISTKLVNLTPAAVDILYPGLNSDLRNASLKFLTCAPVEMGLLEGESAIAKLRTVLGDRTNPDECIPGTIRHKFGIRPGVPFGNAVYHLNALHGSKDNVEAVRDIHLYSSFPAASHPPEP
jgi:nucleoside diphosphate kinase